MTNSDPPMRYEPGPESEDCVGAAFAVDYRHRLVFTRDALDPSNPALADAFGSPADRPHRLLVFVDSGVLEAWPHLPRQIAAYFGVRREAFDVAGDLVVVPGGEGAKNDPLVYQQAIAAIHDAGLCRQSYALVIGGGAVLDVVGYAAATAHRGIRIVRMPTTTLAQADGGLGVKNGINAFGKKNFLGTFAVPWAVVEDFAFLETLSATDFRAGLSEVVKVALLKDAALFRALTERAPGLIARDREATETVVRRSAWLHVDHIATGGDPFERTTSRPLDFGHWSAHKLEQMTAFRLGHGAAVAIGLAIDVLYASEVGLLDESTARLILDTLASLGFALYDEALERTDELLAGLEEFREHLGGRLTITLLRDVGEPVDVHTIDAAAVRRAIDSLAGWSPAERSAAAG